jgi:hypothetical protein
MVQNRPALIGTKAHKILGKAAVTPAILFEALRRCKEASNRGRQPAKSTIQMKPMNIYTVA